MFGVLVALFFFVAFVAYLFLDNSLIIKKTLLWDDFFFMLLAFSLYFFTVLKFANFYIGWIVFIFASLYFVFASISEGMVREGFLVLDGFIPSIVNWEDIEYLEIKEGSFHDDIYIKHKSEQSIISLTKEDTKELVKNIKILKLEELLKKENKTL